MRKIKNRKINSKKIIGLTALILTGGLLTSCVSIAKKDFECTRIECTSDGYYSENKRFGTFDTESNKNPKNSFYYYDKWEQLESGKYSRTVKEYDANSISYDDVRKLIKNETSIEESFGDPIKTYKQVSDTIDDNDINRGAYFEVTIYETNKDKYVNVEDGMAMPIGVVIAETFVLSAGIGGLIAWNKHEEKSSKKLMLEKREK